MSCTNSTVQRRRRLIAAALAVPLSLGMVGSAYATGPADEPRGASETASLRIAGADKELPAQAVAAAEKAELRVADAGQAAPAAEQAAEKAAENKAAVDEKKADRTDDAPAAPGAAAGAASGKSVAHATPPATDTYVNGNANSSKAERPEAPVPGNAPTQPLSKADKNGTGANPGETCTHAYCSNGTGLEPGNGVGDGKAVGQPCAGCVGKADNKNPKGQAPNGNDSNAGYECDRNQGIGKTNPAHTGCTPADTAPVDACPNMDGNQPEGTNCTPGGNNGGGGGGNEDITFCHATGSSTNPYVVITTSKAAAANGHHGVDHQGARDIIPAFSWNGDHYAAQGDQSLLSSGCVRGGTTTFDQCPNLAGDQPAGTVCTTGGNDGGGGSFDQCPDMPGNQPAGTVCTTGGNDGGGGSFDNCPDMPGNQPANTVCTVGSPTPVPPTPVPPTSVPPTQGGGTPISGTPPGQPATNPVPVGPPTTVPPVIVPNAQEPTVIGGPAVLPVDRPLSARAVPSALPFTGGEALALLQLGLLLLIAGVGVGAVARRGRSAV